MIKTSEDIDLAEDLASSIPTGENIAYQFNNSRS